MDNSITFYLASFFIILFLLTTILSKNIFYSLISAICVFFMTAVYFFLLGSEYNAIIQVAVYGFAVPVILGLGIMFTSFRTKRTKGGHTGLKYVLFLVCGIILLTLIYLIPVSSIVVKDTFNQTFDFNSIANFHNNISVFVKNIFVRYILAFELLSVILTITAVGLTVFKYRVRGE